MFVWKRESPLPDPPAVATSFRLPAPAWEKLLLITELVKSAVRFQLFVFNGVSKSPLRRRFGPASGTGPATSLRSSM